MSLHDGLLGGSCQKQELWDKYLADEEKGEDPNVFAHLKLAEDGGFPEVKMMYAHSRWVGAAVLIIFVLYNIYGLVSIDITFISNPDTAVEQQLPLPVTDDEGKLLPFVKTIKDNVLNSPYLCRNPSQWAYNKILQKEGKIPLNPVQLLGLYEMLGLSIHILTAIWACILGCTSSGFKKWIGIATLFWDTMPTLSTYSAMKLMIGVVPAVLTRDLFDHIAILQEAIADKNKKAIVKEIFSIIYWIVSVVVCFCIGFDSFLMKLRLVSGLANTWGGCLPLIQFLVQVLGVVQLGPFVRNRLFLFIFGGEDGVMQDEEQRMMEVWNAMLARRMYYDLAVNKFDDVPADKEKPDGEKVTLNPHWHKFVAVMLSFSDEDFQALVLNEDTSVKVENIGT